ncbi:hypothetical protein V8C35DRAFT_309504 [Trichoderma chlorosporum]
MHEAAVSRLSTTLGQLMGGGMRESNERCVCWEDLDEKTFLRFGEWAYTGDYKPEEPEILLDASQIVSAEANDAAKKPKKEPIANSLDSVNIASFQHCGQNHCTILDRVCDTRTCRRSYATYRCLHCSAIQYNNCHICRGVSTRVSKKQMMITSFNTASKYATPTTTHKPRKNTESCEDYSGVFLSHALLYTLADKYDIPDLSKLSMHKLYATLKAFVIYQDRIGDIVGLVKYSFKNTIPGDGLRTLMVEYCACIVEDICKSKEFQDLVCEIPEFGCELIKKMGDRLD